MNGNNVSQMESSANSHRSGISGTAATETTGGTEPIHLFAPLASSSATDGTPAGESCPALDFQDCLLKVTEYAEIFKKTWSTSSGTLRVYAVDGDAAGNAFLVFIPLVLLPLSTELAINKASVALRRRRPPIWFQRVTRDHKSFPVHSLSVF